MPRWCYPALIVLFLTGHAVCRLLTFHHLEYDEAEQLTLVQTFSLGYYYQPPLFTWLLWPFVQLVGPTIVPLLILRTILFLLLFVLTYRVALRLCTDATIAWLAALSLVLIPEVFHGAIGMWTHTSLLLVLTAALLLIVLRLQERPSTRDYLLLGLTAGLGVLAKYNFVHFAAALALALALTPRGRTVLLDRRLVLSVLVAGLLAAPHGWWMLHHWDEVRHGVVRYTEIRQDQLDGWQGMVRHLSVNLVQTFGRSFGFVLLPLALLLLPAWRCGAREDSSAARRLLVNLLLAAAVLLALVMVFGGVHHLRQHWLTPFAVLVAPLVLAHFDFTRLPTWRLRGYQTVLTLAIVGALVWRGTLILRHDVAGRLNTRDDLYAAQADQLRAAGWDEKYAVAEHPYIAGYLRLHFPQARVRCTYFPSHDVSGDAEHTFLLTWHGGVTELSRFEKFAATTPRLNATLPPADALTLRENDNRNATILRSWMHPARSEPVTTASTPTPH